MLREAESPTEQLLHSHREVLVEFHGILMDSRDSTGRNLCEHGNIPSLPTHSLSTATVNVLTGLGSEVAPLKEKVEEELQSLRKDSQTQKELLLQQHQVREQARSPNSADPRQVSDLEPPVSQLHPKLEVERMSENKVKELEEQLDPPPSEAAEPHTEQDQYGQESGNLRDQIHQLLVLEKERIMESFQQQMGNMSHIVDQHSWTAAAMGVEKSQLIQEINAWKLKAGELKVARDEKEARIHELEARLSKLELEKVQLVNTCTERLQALQDVQPEKDQLMDEFQAGRRDLAGLAQERQYLSRENCKLSEKLSWIRAENIRIAEELEVLRSQDKQLKERVSKMERALDKMLSKLGIFKEEPLQDLKKILQELTSSDSATPSLDLGDNGGRKSPLAPLRSAGHITSAQNSGGEGKEIQGKGEKALPSEDTSTLVRAFM
ncbi:hypothetical protein WISP_55649 [Willisornis vidua]|uniref:Uncharacterized protein n=1 Tax=Willisornis vidua TaxID=1566151 RepID=A0ABQ9DC78_9PASS|nr:hypothetical protein WISP_55649 [Willisornis vidua]